VLNKTTIWVKYNQRIEIDEKTSETLVECFINLWLAFEWRLAGKLREDDISIYENI